MFNELAQEAHETTKSKGFYDNPPNFPTAIALMHSELSEALEEYRKEYDMTTIYHEASGHPEISPEQGILYGWKPEGIPTELADVIIRILDTCAYYGIDIDRAIKLKMDFNKQRPPKHGGKTI